MKSSLSGILAGLAAASIWGGMYVVSKVVLDVVPPFALITTRLVLGILTLAGVLLLSRRALPAWRAALPVFLTGLVGYGISLGFQFVGTKLSTASNGALVTSATPAFVLVFAALILAERITGRQLAALLIASAGVIAVIDPRTARLDPDLFWGNICLLAAALTWALYSVLIRKVTREVDVLATSLIAFAGGLPVCLALGAWEIGTGGLGLVTPGVIGGILFLGVICTALAMYLWNTAFAVLPAGTASLTFFAQPVVGTLLGWLLLGEKITPLFLLGGVLIGVGILISNP